MNWLFKEEPGSYSFDDLITDGGTRWSGVKNPLAAPLLSDRICSDSANLPFPNKHRKSCREAFHFHGVRCERGTPQTPRPPAGCAELRLFPFSPMAYRLGRGHDRRARATRGDTARLVAKAHRLPVRALGLERPFSP